MKHFKKRNGTGLIMHTLAYLLALAIIIAAVMYLWNILLPELFGIAKINYWQSAGLIVLSRLLFGGLGKLHRGFHQFYGIHNHLSKKELNDFHNKIKGMSPCERRDFIRKRMFALDEENEEK
ncbi:MAG: hypothetical protein LBP72_08110 [Dysgonamonadaceae bacterium]|jgi:hypothetical protein|nr:hypothetical protein [Dysgonamonadaceae bacterium]